MITDLQVRSPRLGGVLTDSLPISSLVNDVVIHPNQGELISCDQSGAIKQWDLSENSCTLELVRKHEFWPVLRPSPESSFELSNLSGVFFLCFIARFIFQPPGPSIESFSQTPMGEIPMRSISVASDGSLLVAGNNKVRAIPLDRSFATIHIANPCRCFSNIPAHLDVVPNTTPFPRLNVPRGWLINLGKQRFICTGGSTLISPHTLFLVLVRYLEY